MVDSHGENMRVIGSVLVRDPAVVPAQQLAIEFEALGTLHIVLVVRSWHPVLVRRDICAFVVTAKQILERLLVSQIVSERNHSRHAARDISSS
jgi:hypothetical protein